MWIIISKFEICQNCAHENLYTNNLFTRFCTAFVQNTDKTIKTHLSLHNHAPHTNLTFWSEQTHTSKLTFPSTTTHLTQFTGKLHLTGHFTSQHAPHILVKIESYQQNESCAESGKRQVRSKKKTVHILRFYHCPVQKTHKSHSNSSHQPATSRRQSTTMKTRTSATYLILSALAASASSEIIAGEYVHCTYLYLSFCHFVNKFNDARLC